MRNLKLVIEYDGTDFAGWQRQPLSASQGKKQRTIQDRIETALGMVLGGEVLIIGAGRTDAGVHAKGQVANFQTNADIELARLLYSLNGVLPADIKVRSIAEVPANFNARFDATRRTYRYFITTERSAILRRFTGYYSYDFDLTAMNRCAETILGKHDFAAFSKVKAQTKTKVCTIHRARWYRRGATLLFEIAADRFLHSMVRLIAGTMIQVGNGELTVQDFKRVFDSQDVKQASPSAKASGLFLWHVDYDEKPAADTRHDSDE